MSQFVFSHCDIVRLGRDPPPLRARSALEGEVSLSACAKETEGVTNEINPLLTILRS